MGCGVSSGDQKVGERTPSITTSSAVSTSTSHSGSNTTTSAPTTKTPTAVSATAAAVVPSKPATATTTTTAAISHPTATTAAVPAVAHSAPAVSDGPRRQFHNILICGPPASGKGTFAEKLVAKTGIVHISTGDLLREEAKKGTADGLRAKTFMDAGQLVPQELFLQILKDKLRSPECLARGWLLDGYPRAPEQVQVLNDNGLVPDKVILLQIPDDLAIARLCGRRNDPVTGKIYHMLFNPPPPEIVSRLETRSDDTEEKGRARLEVYHRNFGAAASWWPDRTATINGSGTPDAVFELGCEALNLPRPAPKTTTAVASTTPASTTSTRATTATTHSKYHNVLICGPPASGKGTFAERLVAKTGIIHISTGDLLREEVKKGTPEGLRAKTFMDAGQLVPQELFLQILKDRLKSPECVAHGWLLDGYPRAPEQVKVLNDNGLVPDKVILLAIPDDLAIARLCGRRNDPVTGKIYHMLFNPPPPEIVSRLETRSDDTEEKGRARLQVYHQNFGAAATWWPDRTSIVNGEGTPDSVFALGAQALELA